MLNRRIWILAAVAAATLGLRSSAARADFEYGTSISAVSTVPGATVAQSGQDVNVTAPSGLSTVTQTGIGNFTSPTTPMFTAGTNGVDIKTANIFVTDNSGGGVPYNDIYGMTVTVNVGLTDVTSGQYGTVSFTGTLAGTVGSNGTAFSATFNTDPFGAQTQSLSLGGILYTITAVPGKQFQAPGPPTAGGAGDTGGYSFHVTTSAVPEPGSMALLGIGLVGALGLYRRRANRR